jgi:hypothetical protein
VPDAQQCCVSLSRRSPATPLPPPCTNSSPHPTRSRHPPQASEQQWLLQHNLLPLNVQRKLRNGETVIAESHPAATVLWAEVLGVGGVTAAAAWAAADAQSGQAGSPQQVQAVLQHMLLRTSTSQQLLAAADDGDEAAAAAAASCSTEGAAQQAAGLAPALLNPAEAVVRLNSLYTSWEELCAQQVRS